MTRKKALSNIKHLIDDSDIVFCIGKTLCEEAPVFTDGTFLVFNEYIDGFSLAIGTAITTTKRVIVIAEDGYLLRYFSSILQAAVSKCSNLFFIVLISNVYDTSLTQPTLTRYLRSIEGMLFNAGFLSHNYDKYFENKTSLNKLKSIYSRTIGPVVGLVSIKSNRLYNTDSLIEKTDLRLFRKFILNNTTEILTEGVKTSPLNLDSIVKEK